jgi:N-acetyl-gamma-glutamyl-phosphate reductase
LLVVGLPGSLLRRQRSLRLWRFGNQLALGPVANSSLRGAVLNETDFRFENRRGWIRFRIMTKVAIVGANGYSGEELCAILARHPRVKIASVTSRQHAGKRVTDVLVRLTGLSGISSLVFSEPSIEELLASGADFVFLALPHGLASEFAAPLIDAGKKIVDLSADFRLRDAAVFREFYGDEHTAPELLTEAVLGIPEIHREEISRARLVASAGCYPTSILLPLVPLLKAGLIKPSTIIASSASGVSGAGRKTEASLMFAECHESLHAYGIPKHRHLSEIEQELGWAANEKVAITFVPHLAPMNRGIHTTIFAAPEEDVDVSLVASCWKAAYDAELFIRLPASLPDVKNVNYTNFCDIAVRHDARTGRLIILSALDNLIKGAAGQAVQNFNLMAGFPEAEGLL